MFKALIDAGITLPLESSRERIRSENLRQANPFHDDSCFLVAENIIDDLDIGFQEFFRPNGPRLDTQEDHDKRESAFLEDRYKMLYYAFCTGYKCNQSQFRRVLKLVSYVNIPDIIMVCFVKIITLMLYFRLDEDSDPFFKEFSISYNVACAHTFRSSVPRKVPQNVRDMVSIYEECWDKLLLLYCLEKHQLVCLF
jgi:hypothetical protein